MEKKGCPVVVFNNPDYEERCKHTALLAGVPKVRHVWYLKKRVYEPGFVDPYIPQLIEGLTRPLTDEEMAAGLYTPPQPPRIAMTGTYDEVQEYFLGDLTPLVTGGPYAKWTDGLPITPPTEERVAKMLTGTSHAPDEIVNDGWRPEFRISTVEKVAINAVMAGCTPEMMPVALAMAEVGCCQPGKSGWMYVVSGPIAKEIGMDAANVGGWGNPANMALARFCRLASMNLGGQKFGRGAITGLIMAEGEDSPWEGMNEDVGYGADDSVLIPFGMKVVLGPLETIPLPREATERDEWERKNLEQFIANSKCQKLGHPTGRLLILTPALARKYKEVYGFDTLQELQDYLWDNVTWPAGVWYDNYWFYMSEPIIRRANEHGVRHWCMDHLDLPDDALVPMIPSPEDFKVLVREVPGTSTSMNFATGQVGCGPFPQDMPQKMGMLGCPVPIDKWR